MASLLIKSAGFCDQVLDLKMGLNRCGRSPANDFQIEHATVSAKHCELVLSDSELIVRDCDSTNGTYLDGKRIHSGILCPGQILRLGDVELLVENTSVEIAIPKLPPPLRPAPPVVLTDGSLICPRHPEALATHQCTHCREVMCDACVHRLRRRGGKLWKLCPRCSHVCEPIGAEKKKKSLFSFLQKTVKLPFLRSTKKPAEEEA